MKLMIGTVVAAALMLPSAASAICFTRPQMRAVAAVAAGPLINNVVAHCAAFPGGAPNLVAARPSLAGRFRSEATAAASIVAPAISQLLGQPETDPQRLVAAVTPFLDLMLGTQVAKLGQRTCRNIDDMGPAVLPLSDRQVVDILGAALVAGARDRPSLQFSLCEDERR